MPVFKWKKNSIKMYNKNNEKTSKSKQSKTKNKLKTSFLNIRFKLIAAFLIIIIPIVMLGLTSYKMSSESLKKQAEVTTFQTMSKTSQYLSLIFDNMESASMQLISNKNINDYLNSNNNDSINYDMVKSKKTVEEAVKGIIFNNEHIYDIVIIGNGTASITNTQYRIYNSDMEVLNMDRIKDSTIYNNAIAADGKPVWLSMHHELDEFCTDYNKKNFSASLVRTFKDMSSFDTIGILVLDVKFDALQNEVNDINLGNGSEVHLISTDNIDISHAIDENGESSDKTLSITELDFYKDIKQSEKQEGFDTIYINDNEYLMTYSKVGKTGYVLLGILPSSELLKTARSILTMTIILVCIASAMAIGIGLYMGMGMGNTIKRIIYVANQAASGNLTINASTKRKDEFGVLTRSISSMISNMKILISHASDISKKVADSANTVSDASGHVSSVSEEISRAIMEISTGASEQASDAEKSSAKIDTLSGRINEVSETTVVIEKLSTKTMQLTQKGLSSIANLNKKAQETTTKTKEIVTTMNSLDTNAKSIGKIVSVINSIADQTNLLALNAAIEAARAGEMGKGFAVVADEIRKLAEQSVKATGEIGEIINQTQQQTTNAVERVSEAEETLKSQNDAVTETIDVFNSIKSSMDNLVQKVNEILDRVDEMHKDKEDVIISIQNISAVSQQTAASAEEVTASTQEQNSSIQELNSYAEELKDAANNLSDSISKFKVN